MQAEITTAARIAALNDAFRRNPSATGGRVVMTQGVAALDERRKAALARAVQLFDAFTPENDPYGEHDLGEVELETSEGRTRFFWKIDYYDAALEFGSKDPSDHEQTTRVLTIMRADEY